MGLNSLKPATRRFSLAALTPMAAATSPMAASPCGRNSCSGGSSRRMVTGAPAMISNSSMKSLRCMGRSLASARAPALGIVGEDHLAHRHDAALLEEHMLGAAKPDAVGAEGKRLAGVGGRVGVGAHLHAAELIGPAHQRQEVRGKRRLAHRHAALDDLAGRAVDGHDVALAQDLVAELQRLALKIDLHRGRADDARPSHAARHHRRVARHAAARGDDAGGGVHALHVLRRGLDPGEDQGVALRLEMHRFVGVEHELA